jgi:hypothetical protein
MQPGLQRKPRSAAARGVAAESPVFRGPPAREKCALLLIYFKNLPVFSQVSRNLANDGKLSIVKRR